jgi:hypothetical protein
MLQASASFNPRKSEMLQGGLKSMISQLKKKEEDGIEKSSNALASFVTSPEVDLSPSTSSRFGSLSVTAEQLSVPPEEVDEDEDKPSVQTSSSEEESEGEETNYYEGSCVDRYAKRFSILRPNR